jgi:hypothetical protein
MAIIENTVYICTCDRCGRIQEFKGYPKEGEQFWPGWSSLLFGSSAQVMKAMNTNYAGPAKEMMKAICKECAKSFEEWYKDAP